MTYNEAMAAIRNGALKSVYLIAGEETYLADKMERALLEKLLPDGNKDGLDRRNGDVSVEELMNLINTVPFFGDRNILVIRNTTLFKEKKKAGADQPKAGKTEEGLVELLEDMPPYSVLILRSNEKADKRRKLYKTIAKCGCAVEVAAIRPWEVKDWLPGKLKEIDRQFDRAAQAYFLEAISVMNTVSLGFLEQELDKLALYSDQKVIVKADLLEVLAAIPEVSIFSMLDAISDQDVKKALRLLTEQLRAGAHPLKMVTMLSRHTRQLWQAKRMAERGLSGRQMAAELALVPFVAEKLAAKSRRFEERVLCRGLVDLAEADYQLKSGQADVALLERIVIELCAS